MNEPLEEPIINTLDDAAFWIGVMHRRTIDDARRISDLYERLATLRRIPILGRYLRRKWRNIC